MKKALGIVLVIAAVAAGLALYSCAGLSGGAGSSGSSGSGARPYTGDGGKGMSVAVLVPEGKGLGEGEAYLPTLVQGVFVEDFSRYSAMSVLDRQNLEKVLRESESGIYESQSDFLELGKITQTGYALTGSVTKTQTAYTFSIAVTDTASGQTKAAYNGSCTIAEFDNFSGIRKASGELLTQMGVRLTDAAKAELSGAAAAQSVKAQTALAQGITAQKSGNTAASLGYYYQANQYDPKLKEAAARVNQLSASVRTGNLGDNIRNDIAWRNEWVKLFEEAADYLKNNPDVLVSFSYSPKLKLEKVSYSYSGSAEFSFNVEWALIKEPPSIKILQDLDKGVKATGRSKDWDLRVFISESQYSEGLNDTFDTGYFRRSYTVEIELFNNEGKQIATGSLIESRGSIGINTGWESDWASQFLHGYIQLYPHSYRSTDGSTTNWFSTKYKDKVVFHVFARDITDNMTIKIVNVTESKDGRVLRSGPDIIPVYVK